MPRFGFRREGGQGQGRRRMGKAERVKVFPLTDPVERLARAERFIVRNDWSTARRKPAIMGTKVQVLPGLPFISSLLLLLAAALTRAIRWALQNPVLWVSWGAEVLQQCRLMADLLLPLAVKQLNGTFAANFLMILLAGAPGTLPVGPWPALPGPRPLAQVAGGPGLSSGTSYSKLHWQTTCATGPIAACGWKGESMIPVVPSSKTARRIIWIAKDLLVPVGPAWTTSLSRTIRT